MTQTRWEPVYIDPPEDGNYLFWPGPGFRICIRYWSKRWFGSNPHLSDESHWAELPATPGDDR